MALAGGPGSGKSLLMLRVAGLGATKRGRIRVLGDRPGSLRARERGVYLFQRDNFAPDRSVAAQLTRRAALWGMSPDRASEAVVSWCGDHGLSDVADRTPSRLNLSDLHMLALAQLELARPLVAIMDDPLREVATSRLDEAIGIMAGLLERCGMLVLCQMRSPLLDVAGRVERLPG